MSLRAWITFLGLLPIAMAEAKERVAVKLLNERSAEYNVTVGHPLPETLRFRVVREDDESIPVPGVTVEVGISFPLCLPLLPCDVPPAALYGYFLVDGTPKTFAHVRADAAGYVEVPVFVAGQLEGSYSLYATIYVSFQPEDTPVDLIFNNHDLRSRRIEINQRLELFEAHVASGTWSFDGASSQGLLLQELPSRRVVGGWFTWVQDAPRWYVVDSCVEASCSVAGPNTWRFNIYRVRDGAAFERRTTSSSVVGQISLRLTGCGTGLAEVDLHDTDFTAKKTLLVTNLTPTACH